VTTAAEASNSRRSEPECTGSADDNADDNVMGPDGTWRHGKAEI
jgi:hypothetical protein